VTSRSLPNRRQAILVCLAAGATALVCGGLMIAAALVPAPPAVLPLIAAVCIGCPVLAAWELPIAITVLRATRSSEALDRRALSRLRRHLDGLPETEHPLGH
jgi:hypothetical protein